MTESAPLWIALALLLFWSVGAYNRLMRLRAQAIAAFQLVGSHQDRYLTLVDDSLKSAAAAAPAEEPVAPVGDAAAAWAGLQGASTQFDASLRVVRKQPLNAAATAALQTAHAVLQSAWARVQEQCHGQAERPDASSQAAWHENTRLASHATEGFNRAVLAYNAAIAQFPALVLARLFGFRPAGCL